MMWLLWLVVAYLAAKVVWGWLAGTSMLSATAGWTLEDLGMRAVWEATHPLEWSAPVRASVVVGEPVIG